MIKNKLYENVKPYFDKYLFGFDANQIEFSVLKGIQISFNPPNILKGSISISNVNVKANKANKFLSALMIPFAMKAGTIGKLELKVSLMYMWNGPIDLQIDELFLILGPNLSVVSHNESYLEEDENSLEDSYDEGNMFNIFEHQIKIKKKIDGKKKMTGGSHSKDKKQSQEPQQLDKQTMDFIKNMNLKINKFHLRIEDDYYSAESPYSLGLVFENLVWESSEQLWSFNSLSNKSPTQNKIPSDLVGSLIKNLKFQNIRFYWNSMSEMYIPSCLWLQTMNQKAQIFEVMTVKQLKTMLLEVFQKEKEKNFQFMVTDQDFSCQFLYFSSEKEQQNQNNYLSQLQLSVLMTKPFSINIAPQTIEDINNLVDFCQNYFLSKDLKQYRPHRRPITSVPQALENDQVLKRKRRLIVRDWFFYVVWYVRLKRILKSLYSTELLQQELESNSKYEEILKILENPNASLNDLKLNFQQSKENNQKKNKEQINNNLERSFLRLINLRIEQVDINLYQKSLSQSTHPSFTLSLSNVSVEKKCQCLQEKLQSLNTEIKYIEVSTYIQRNRKNQQLNRGRGEQQQFLALGSNEIPNTFSTINSFVSTKQTPFNQGQDLNEIFNNNQPKTSNISQGNQQQFLTIHQKKSGNYTDQLFSPTQIKQSQRQITETDCNNNVRQLKLTSDNYEENSTNEEEKQNQERSLFGVMIDKVLGGFGNPVNSRKQHDRLKRASSYDEFGQLEEFQQTKNSHHKLPDSTINKTITKVLSNEKGDQSQYNRRGEQQMFSNNTTFIKTNIPSKQNSHQKESNRVGTNIHSLKKYEQKNGGGGVSDVLDNLFNDPMHKYIMSNNMSIKELKSTIEEQNRMNREKRQTYNDGGKSTPDKLNTSALQGFTNKNNSHFKMAGGLHDSFQNEIRGGDNNNGYNKSLISQTNNMKQIMGGKQDIKTQRGDPRQYLRNFKNNIPLPQTNHNNNNNLKRATSSKQEISSPSFADRAIYTQSITESSQQQQQSFSQNNKNSIPVKVYKELGNQDYVLKCRIYQLFSSSDNQPSFLFKQEKTISNNSADKSCYKLKCQIGETHIAYTNEILKALFEIFIEMKKLNVFRDINIQSLLSRESRETSAQRKIELMMPFYIIRKLVQNHKLHNTKNNKTLNLPQLKQHLESDQQDIFRQKIQSIDHYFRNYIMEVVLNMQKSEIVLYSEEDQQFCQLKCPQITGQVYKTNQNCGFEVLGFQFQGMSSLHVVSDFATALHSHLHFMNSHPAIQRGVTFYKDLHSQFKKKARTMKESYHKRQTSNGYHQQKQKEIEQFFKDDLKQMEGEKKRQRKSSYNLGSTQSIQQQNIQIDRPCPNLGFLKNVQNKQLQQKGQKNYQSKQEKEEKSNRPLSENQVFQKKQQNISEIQSPVFAIDKGDDAKTQIETYKEEDYLEDYEEEGECSRPHIQMIDECNQKLRSDDDDTEEGDDDILNQMSRESDLQLPMKLEPMQTVLSNKHVNTTTNKNFKDASNHLKELGNSSEQTQAISSQYSSQNKLSQKVMQSNFSKPLGLMENCTSPFNNQSNNKQTKGYFAGIQGKPLQKQKQQQQIKENTNILLQNGNQKSQISGKTPEIPSLWQQQQQQFQKMQQEKQTVPNMGSQYKYSQQQQQQLQKQSIKNGFCHSSSSSNIQSIQSSNCGRGMLFKN